MMTGTARRRKSGVLMQMTPMVTRARKPVLRKSRMMMGRLLSIVSTSRENLHRTPNIRKGTNFISFAIDKSYDV